MRVALEANEQGLPLSLDQPYQGVVWSATFQKHVGCVAECVTRSTLM